MRGIGLECLDFDVRHAIDGVVVVHMHVLLVAVRVHRISQDSGFIGFMARYMGLQGGAGT